MSEILKLAIEAGSKKWRDSFNAGNAVGCASCYQEDARMVATPFGEFEGRAAIQSFWEQLIANGFTDVQYINPKLDIINATSAIISSDWSMNKASGVITKELWVLQDDGTARMQEDHFEAKR